MVILTSLDCCFCWDIRILKDASGRVESKLSLKHDIRSQLSIAKDGAYVCTYTCEQFCGLYKPGVDLPLVTTEMKWEVVYLSLAAIFTYH